MAMNIRWLKKVTKPAKGSEDILEELEELREETQPISGFENLPTVSVNENDLIKVRFLEEPREVPRKSDGKLFAYATVQMLAAHAGYNRENKEEIPLKEGDKAALDLRRHVNLWKGAQENTPLKDKKFVIGIVGTLPSKKGKPAMDYRWKAIA